MLLFAANLHRFASAPDYPCQSLGHLVRSKSDGASNAWSRRIVGFPGEIAGGLAHECDPFTKGIAQMMRALLASWLAQSDAVTPADALC